MFCKEQQSESQYMESSIIIPVFNQWKFTRSCLTALASTIQDKAVEVIVIDNASTDLTPEACPVLGRQLFGDAFRYHRCASNKNFGPASNLGAKMAAGEFLIFLNNDTVPLPGWYQPLIDDFSRYPHIAATGPLLLYPKSEPFGHTVQHLGVVVSPFSKLGHLYEGIPAGSPLAQKRRFFQIITAACMVIRRELFLAAGMFDEKFINGFEDVELCLRLKQEGYRMTVNPKAKVIHYTSQTPNRSQHEEENARYLSTKCRGMTTPDWHEHLHNDGLSLQAGQWQIPRETLPPEQCRRLDAIAATASCDELTALLVRYPFWENGWRRLIDVSPSQAVRTHAQDTLFDFYPSPDKALAFHKAALATRDAQQAEIWLKSAIPFCKSIEEYSAAARNSRAWCARIGLPEMEAQYANWLADAERFNAEQLQPFLEALWRALVSGRVALPPHAAWAYTVWRHTVDRPRRAANTLEAALCDGIAFSLLMPVQTPHQRAPEHLAATLDSVLAQDCPQWELCVTVGASASSETTALLTRYAEKDARIRLARQTENSRAAVTSAALEMARHPWIVLLDQDGLLTPDALRRVAETIAKHPDGLLFYSDEDTMDDAGVLSSPYFKNDKWDWEFLLSQNYVSHLGVYRTDRMRAIGGFREGFSDSQDHDMLLRYVQGADTATLIHIASVLYHGRAPANSTARKISASQEQAISTGRAVQNILKTASPGAMVCVLPGSQWNRVKYPLPAQQPLVSLICDMGEDLPLLQAQLAALTAKTAYTKYELLVLYSENCPPPALDTARRLAEGHPGVRLLAHTAGLPQAERLQHAADQAQGQVLGFVPAGLTPASEGWLEELVACLCRNHTGACGGKVAYPNGSMAHGGYLTDASGRLKALFQGAPAHQPIWFEWNRLARTVDALDGLCCFTRRETLERMGGLDASLPESSIQDYCLRLGAAGLRTIWWPFAEFMLPRNNPRSVNRIETDRAFQERWAGKLTPCNKNLVIVEGNWEFKP